jgi:SAM-dependent methyltransferase
MMDVFQQFVRPAYLTSRSIGSRLIDRRFGITTTDELVAREMENEVGHFRRVYRAMPFSAIWRLMRRIDPGPEDVLLDIGCGAGRVICMAAQYPFARVIGVDVDEAICALAERNARTLRRCRTRPVVHCADATRYRVPDDVTTVVLYNPFRGDVLRAALERILESVERAPRRLRVLYANPVEHSLFVSMGRFRETERTWMSWRPGTQWKRTQMIRHYDIDGGIQA